MATFENHDEVSQIIEKILEPQVDGVAMRFVLAQQIMAAIPESLDSGWCPYDCGHCHQDDCGCSNCTGGE